MNFNFRAARQLIFHALRYLPDIRQHTTEIASLRRHQDVEHRQQIPVGHHSRCSDQGEFGDIAEQL